MLFEIRDPFAGEFTIEGPDVERAVADHYGDITEDERPTYVWHEGKQIPVPGGTCNPVPGEEPHGQ